MTDMPPPYPGINAASYQGYASGGNPAGVPGAWGNAGGMSMPPMNGTPNWANPSYNGGQPMSQAGAYPYYGQQPYNSAYPQNPPPYYQHQ